MACTLSGSRRPHRGGRKSIPLLCVLAVSASVSLAGPAALDKVVAFPAADSLRVACTLQTGPGPEPVRLEATLAREGTGRILWQGALGQTDAREGRVVLEQTITNLQPELWSPQSPALYQLMVEARQAGQTVAEKNVRVGFRSFTSRAGQFLLNGRPVFLRGIAINPPGRSIPPAVGESRAFAEAYVRFLKQQHVNIIRLTHDSQVWFDVCDELGMLVYQGQYGSPPGSDEGKQRPPADFDRSLQAYQALFETYAPHPSIVIYILANELPVSGARGRAFHEFLSRAHAALKQWDSTRLYIGNARYGEGREGDICDVHRYWGWYYNSFLTYYNLRDLEPARPLFGNPHSGQPLTFTECVGCFTGSTGEFNLVRSKQLGAQLCWTGHSGLQREDALEYQSFMTAEATESFRRLRPLNPRLGGIMPFSIFFYHWSGIGSFEQMQPKPALRQLALSYQPVLLSWELWTPQLYAGARLRAVAHVVNDSDDGRALTNASLTFALRDRAGRSWADGRMTLPAIPYFGTWSARIEVSLPAGLDTGQYRLCGLVRNNPAAGDAPEGMVLSTNAAGLFIAGEEWKRFVPAPPGEVWLYDPAGHTRTALTRLSLQFHTLAELGDLGSRRGALVIGEEAWDTSLAPYAPELRKFVTAGGRLLFLRQKPGSLDGCWFPEQIVFLAGSANDPDYPPKARPFAEQMDVNPERPLHPVFAGLDRHQFARWSDYTGWDQTRAGFPRICPVTAGFKLRDPGALARTAVLADYDRGLEGIALCEMFHGSGSVILSAFDLVNRVGLDPVVDRFLANLFGYTASTNAHFAHPLIVEPIEWGDYPTEQGLVCGPLNGLLVNADWVAPRTNPSAAPLPPNTGSWNMQPGDQFVARGRNPFGAFGFTTSTSLRDLNPGASEGTGVFWARIPPGRAVMLTKVNNPGPDPAQLTVAIGQHSVLAPQTIPAGRTLELRSALPDRSGEVEVRYTGSKKLVLLETRFE